MSARASWIAAGALTTFVIGVLIWGARAPRPAAVPAQARVLSDRLLPHCLYGLDPHANGVLTRLQDAPGYGLRVAAFDLRAWMGFQTGDTLVEVNGHRLGGAEDWYRARQGVEGARLCDWTILRDGRTTHLYAWREESPRVIGDFDRNEVLALLTDPYLSDQPGGDRHEGVEEVLQRAGAVPGARFVRGPEGSGSSRVGLRAYLIASVQAEPGATVVVDAGDGSGPQTLEIVWTGDWPAQRITPLEGSLLPGDEYPAPEASWRAAPRGLGVTRVPGAPETFELPRSALARSFGELESLSKLGRAVPHRDASGAIDGIQLIGVTPGSRAQQLGVRDGDVIHAVNGVALFGPKPAIEAMSGLQSADEISFEITRDGERKRLIFVVVDR